jgi:RND family efflux transporter MFP subunit
MNPSTRLTFVTAAIALVAAAATLALHRTGHAADAPPSAQSPAQSSSQTAKPALTVNVATPQKTRLTLAVPANGSLHAWQEASVGAEASGWRLAAVHVNVGDRVKRGQVLARFAAELPQADLAQIQAVVAEAEATLAEAAANAQRARELQASGALSAQQINQYLTAERTAQARLEAQRAAVRVQQLRLAQADVRAPDDGVISARSATVGAVVGAGQELFRLIRQGRLEWRAEVPAEQLARVRPGQAARVTPSGGPVLEGRVRMVGPTVDPATRQGLVYVDLPQPGAAKAGMFARGELALGEAEGLTLPQSAVLLRDGFHVVMLVGADGRLSQRKVEVGRRTGERIEITGGLPSDARVVASGGAFLGDGDTVRVVAAAGAKP